MRQRFAALRARVEELTRAAGRQDEVDILLAVKTHSAGTIREAIEAGGRHIGHNRAQELAATEPDLGDLEHETHLIGTPQSNKVTQAPRHALCTHTVHTTRLADPI